MAADLAAMHEVDKELVDLAAMAHDPARAMPGDDLLAEARRLKIPTLPLEEQTPVLLHGPIATQWLEDTLDIHDREVIEAVRWHTTGRTGMGRVAKLVYLADKLEPEKVRQDPGLEASLSLVRDSLDKALLTVLDHQIASFVTQGYLIHPACVEMRNELLSELRPVSG